MQVNHNPQTESLISRSSVEDSQQKTPIVAKPRLQCLDAFRGFTMAGMILVDNQGAGQYAIWPFAETQWNGISTADMVFPSFLFINGMSIYLALKPEMGRDKKTWLKIFKRVFLMFLIGFLLNLQIKNFNILHTRIMGVLQRIAICYFVVACLRLLVKDRSHQLMIMSLFPAIYIGLMYGVEVPDGCGKGNLSNTCNFGAFVDHKIFGPDHMIKPNDPEGIVTTLNAIFNTYMGLSFMEIFQKDKANPSKLIRNWAILSSYLTLLSIIILPWCPYNKKIWSSSFALLTSGMSGFSLLFCFFLVDYYKNRITEKLKWPLIWLGMNPLFIFVAMIFWEALLMWNIRFEENGQRTSLWLWITQKLFMSWLHSGWIATTVVAFLYLIIWTIIAKWMYDRQIFVKL